MFLLIFYSQYRAGPGPDTTLTQPASLSEPSSPHLHLHRERGRGTVWPPTTHHLLAESCYHQTHSHTTSHRNSPPSGAGRDDCVAGTVCKVNVVQNQKDGERGKDACNFDCNCCGSSESWQPLTHSGRTELQPTTRERPWWLSPLGGHSLTETESHQETKHS